MNVIIKIVGIFFLCLFVLASGAVLWMFISVKKENGKADSYLSQSSDILPSESSEKIFQSTYCLFDSKDEFVGRGHLYKDAYLILNRHMMKRFCNGFPDCRSSQIHLSSQLQIQLGNKNHEEYKDFENPICISWLDICVIKLPGRKADNLAKNLKAKVDDEAFMPNLDLENKIIIKGYLIDQHDFLLTYEMPSRRGYSGSPLFDKMGNPVAIVFANTFEGYINFPEWFITNPFKLKTLAVKLDAVTELIDCHIEKRGDLCISKESRLFQRIRDNLRPYSEQNENIDTWKQSFYFNLGQEFERNKEGI